MKFLTSSSLTVVLLENSLWRMQSMPEVQKFHFCHTLVTDTARLRGYH